MTSELKVFELLQKRALITRDSAKALGRLFQSAEGREIVLDFEGVDAVTPSFVDELLSELETGLSDQHGKHLRIVFLNAPTRLSAKFAAIGRARHLEIVESEGGTWTIVRSTTQEAV